MAWLWPISFLDILSFLSVCFTRKRLRNTAVCVRVCDKQPSAQDHIFMMNQFFWRHWVILTASSNSGTPNRATDCRQMRALHRLRQRTKAKHSVLFPHNVWLCILTHTALFFFFKPSLGHKVYKSQANWPLWHKLEARRHPRPREPWPDSLPTPGWNRWCEEPLDGAEETQF